MKTTTKNRGTSPTGKRYDEAFKLDAVRLLQQTGRSRAQVARDLGVSTITLAAWVTRYGTDGERPAARRTRIHDPSARHFKKGHGHHGAGPEERFEMITAMRHEYHIDELCTAFAVSRSGYYAHLRKPSGRRRCEDEALRPRVAAAFRDSRLTYGTPRLRGVLVREGTAISRERIGRIMRELGLQPLQKRSFIPRTTRADPAATPAPRSGLGQRHNVHPDR